MRIVSLNAERSHAKRVVAFGVAAVSGLAVVTALGAPTAEAAPNRPTRPTTTTTRPITTTTRPTTTTTTPTTTTTTPTTTTTTPVTTTTTVPVTTTTTVPSTAGPQCTAVYRVINAWATSFQADVEVIVPATSTTPNSWTVTFTYDGAQRLTQFFNAFVSQSGPTITATPQVWNAAIPPGTSIHFGFFVEATSPGALLAPPVCTAV